VATGYVPAGVSRRASDAPTGAEAVDDLIKFRLVESLLRQPDQPATAAELAARLGFHSVDVTGMALDELTDAGVAIASRPLGELTYRLSPDPPLRVELADLVAAGPPGLFNRLAAASVVRIKRLLKKGR
jgi:hypothetical protein